QLRVVPATGRQPVLFVAAALFVGGIAGGSNTMVLHDILPDLLGIAPPARAFGIGRAVSTIAPLAIVAAEALGAAMGGGGRLMFGTCLLFEIAAAFGRAVALAVDPYPTSGAWQYSPTGLSQGVAFLTLGVVLPLVLYQSLRFVEPSLRRFS